MIESLVLAIVLTQVPVTPQAPEALGREGLLVQATQTHFSAVNDSPRAWWLAIGIAGSEHRVVIRIDPGVSNTWPLFGGPDQGLVLEALTPRAGELLHTGSLPLDAVRVADDGALWVRDEGLRAVGYRTRQAQLERLHSDVSLTSAARGEAEEGFEGDMIPTVHVPVVTPGETRGKTKPPVIDKKPLPPV